MAVRTGVEDERRLLGTCASVATEVVDVRADDDGGVAGPLSRDVHSPSFAYRNSLRPRQ